MMDSLVQDLRYAVRALRKRPLFTLVAAVSLAAGIGGITTIFSVVNVLLIRPPSGIPDADVVVEVGRTRDGQGFDTFSYPDFRDIREHVAPLSEVSAWDMREFSLSRAEGGERVLGMLVSANYFDVLGVRPRLGRGFVSAEDKGVGEHPVVVLGYRLWRRMGGEPELVGSTITLNRHEYTVVGVAPEGFFGHYAGIRPELYVPLSQIQELTGRRPALNEHGIAGDLSVRRRSRNRFRLLGRRSALLAGTTGTGAHRARLLP